MPSHPPPRDRHVRRDGDAYAAQFLALLPQGQAWPKWPGSTLERATNGLSQYWGFVDARAGDLLEQESDPRKTIELLPDWERAWGLPDPCLQEPLTIGERQRVLVQRITMLGAQSRDWFKEVASWLGYDITIDEFSPWIVGISRCGWTADDGVVVVNDQQTISIDGTVTGGWFKLIFGGVQSDEIPYNADATTIVDILSALPAIGEGNLSAYGGPLPGLPINLTFVGDLVYTRQQQFALGTNYLLGGRDTPTGAKAVITADVQDGGSGYIVNDSVTLSNGVVLAVDAESSGAITTVSIANPGNIPGDVSPPANPVAQTATSGAGTGGTFNLTWAGAARPVPVIEHTVIGSGRHNKWEIAYPEIRFYWRVHVDTAKLTWFRCASGQCGVDPHLRIGLATDLECLFRRWMPAQTDIVFDYSGLSVGGSMAGTP